MTTYIYQGKEITHTSFISLLRSAGINGGRKLSYHQILEREATKGNQKAIEILNNLVAVEDSEKTYDVAFSDGTDSNSKGFKSSLDYCKNYIHSYNGTDESYFADYKSGTVSVVCNETGEEIYVVSIK